MSSPHMSLSNLVREDEYEKASGTLNAKEMMKLLSWRFDKKFARYVSKFFCYCRVEEVCL